MNSPCERAEENALTADALKTNALNSDLTSRPTKMAAPALSKTPHVYRTGGGWGDACNFLNYESRKVSGHKQRIPRVGDLLECPMQSGRTGVYRFTEVERVGDPPDMFFGTVEDVGFKDEIDAAAQGDAR